MNIKKATVLVDPFGPDYVFLHTNLPNPFPNMPGTSQLLTLTFQVEADKGAEYCRKNFRIQPEVIMRAGGYGKVTDQLCPTCNGAGGFLAGHNASESIDCGECNGAGKVKK